MKLKSIIKSRNFIPKFDVKLLKTIVSLPDMLKVAQKSRQELRNLAISKVMWNGTVSFGLTLNDDQAC